MRLVIDKDVSDIQLLQEAYEKGLPTYKVLAVESDGEKFVYGKGLVVQEVSKAVSALVDDENFKDCKVEVVECSGDGKESKTVWASDEKTVVSESTVFNEGWLDAMKKMWKGVGEWLNNKFGKFFDKWKQAKYVTDNWELTGLGYKIANGDVKPEEGEKKDDNNKETPKEGEAAPVNEADANAQLQASLKKILDVKKTQCQKALQTMGIKVQPGDIQGIPVNDSQPVNFQVKVSGENGDEYLMMTQKGDLAQGDGKGNVDKGTVVKPEEVTPDKVKEMVDVPTDGETPTDGEGEKNGEAAAGDLETRVSNIEQALREKKILTESTMNWNFNNQQLTNKAGVERFTIKRFFNELNDQNVKEIVLVESTNGKTTKLKRYSTSDGSKAYAEFKKDFRESTGSFVGKDGLYKVTIESGTRCNLKGFKFSDFGMSDDFDSNKKVVVVKSAFLEPQVESSKKKSEETPKVEVTVEKPVVNESFVLEMGEALDPKKQVESLLESMAKFNPGPNTKASAPTDVTTYGMPEVVGEADDDDEGGGDEGGGDDAGGDDPFGGGDAGGGEADPFAGGGDDAGGGDEGGDMTAGDVEGGGDAGGGGDPFGGDAGGGGASGGDVGGGDAGGGDAGGEAGGEDPAAGEPAPPDAVNTDAQGNEKSQYNINVTKPFNSEESFSLNEEEQKEFFGKIDQLVKIPDMDNYSLYLYQITPENMNLDDVHYIEALYQLSVKLGLLEDIYADSNLLEKYNSYKYSVLKTGEDDGEDEGAEGTGEPMTVQESVSKVQDDNEKKNEESKKIGSSEKDDERRGPKDMKLDLDKNGAPKPVIIDTTKEGWDSLNGKEHKKAIDATTEGDFHGLGWIATFKAMQFGSPRYLSLYIKKNGDAKAEKQCEDYLKKLSYTDIEFVNIDEVDPYEYVYRQFAGAKTPEEIRTAKYANEGVPVTYLESTDKKVNVGDFIDTPADTFGGNGWNTVLARVIEVDGDKFIAKAVDSTGRKSWQLEVVGKTKEMRGNSTYGKTTEDEFRELKKLDIARESAETKVPESIPGDIKRDIKRVITKLNAEIRGTKQFNFIKECGVEKPQIEHSEFLAHYKTAQFNETMSETTYKFVLRKNDSTLSRMFFSNLKEKLFKYLGSYAQKFGMECGCEATPKAVVIDFMRSNLDQMPYDLDTMVDANVALPETTDQI